ncbi:hypothetical protein C1645_748033 [Glomus cerebriforme]|uniref:Uncharacterized protein n=1 Tax=Glomus cerebriforme TaxID=658196 RepID=A0A397TMC4_9GLOM|nr:hypothetical protein C1645_748033 [Glomus cerebriforme]
MAILHFGSLVVFFIIELFSLGTYRFDNNIMMQSFFFMTDIVYLVSKNGMNGMNGNEMAYFFNIWF